MNGKYSIKSDVIRGKNFTVHQIGYQKAQQEDNLTYLSNSNRQNAQTKTVCDLVFFNLDTYRI